MLAYQIAFDLYESATQQFVAKMLQRLMQQSRSAEEMVQNKGWGGKWRCGSGTGGANGTAED